MEQVNTIYLTAIGSLNQDSNFSDWWNSSIIEIPFFGNKKLQITCMGLIPEKDIAFLDDANNALKNFLNLTLKDRNAISEMVYKNCMDFLEAVDFEESETKRFTGMEDKNDIWRFVHPAGIYVSRRHRRDKDIYIQAVCNCDWDAEHGLQLIFRQGKKLTRISEQDGHLTKADAFNIPDEEDELLSAF